MSEVDKKGKKKKGTLGIGNGSLFFASESDKARITNRSPTLLSLTVPQTPVQKWSTADVADFRIEKSKHVHIDIGGANAISLHFSVGSKDNSDAITSKLSSSKALTQLTEITSPTSPPTHEEPGEELEEEEHDKTSISRSRTPSKAVHFSVAEPALIPPREPSITESDADIYPEQPTGPRDGLERATALYDFDADGEDELGVREGDVLVVLDRDSDEWWKCRNEHGAEGVVPASYLEVRYTPLCDYPGDGI